MYRYRLYRRSATARKNDLGRHADGSSPVALSVSKKGRPRSRWAQSDIDVVDIDIDIDVVDIYT